MLTLEEQERRAYIGGNVVHAALLARCLDGDDDLAADKQQAEERLKQEERDNETLQQDLTDAEDKIADLTREVERLEAEPRCICGG